MRYADTVAVDALIRTARIHMRYFLLYFLFCYSSLPFEVFEKKKKCVYAAKITLCFAVVVVENLQPRTRACVAYVSGMNVLLPLTNDNNTSISRFIFCHWHTHIQSSATVHCNPDWVNRASIRLAKRMYLHSRNQKNKQKNCYWQLHSWIIYLFVISSTVFHAYPNNSANLLCNSHRTSIAHWKLSHVGFYLYALHTDDMYCPFFFLFSPLLQRYEIIYQSVHYHLFQHIVKPHSFSVCTILNINRHRKKGVLSYLITKQNAVWLDDECFLPKFFSVDLCFFFFFSF